jgi:hypothetical protein
MLAKLQTTLVSKVNRLAPTISTPTNIVGKIGSGFRLPWPLSFKPFPFIDGLVGVFGLSFASFTLTPGEGSETLAAFASFLFVLRPRKSERAPFDP